MKDLTFHFFILEPFPFPFFFLIFPSTRKNVCMQKIQQKKHKEI